MFGLFKGKKSPPEVPNAEAEPDRYVGKPLLILLENYVLACIGELQPERHIQIGALVQKVFGGGEDWQLTLREQLQLGDSLDESLRNLWRRNQDIARQNNVTLHSVQFAKMIADTNFAHLIEARR